MILAAHQPSLIPWLVYFRKMHMADKFVIMNHVSFEKNGYTNRFRHKDKWMTNPVKSKVNLIIDKEYVSGYKVPDINVPLIVGFARLLGIDTKKLICDEATIETGTERIIDYCKKLGCDQYLTNPTAEDKYLDVKKMKEAGIEVVPFKCTNEYKIPLFEAFEKWGIEGTRKMVHKQWKE